MAAQADDPRPSVLLCEDNPISLLDLKQSLTPLAREVTAVSSSRTALFEFSRRRPDVLVTDVNMPGMDGIELATAVRAISPDAPVLLVTAMDDVEHLRRALATGVSEYLVKPVTPEALAAALARASRTLHSRQELERQRRLNAQMLEANPNPTALVATDSGLVRACNPKAREMGFAVGAPCPEELVPGGLLEALRHMGRHGGKTCVFAPASEVSGHGRSWLLHWAPVGADQVLLTLADITSRKAAEEALREESRRLSDVIFGTGVGTWEWNVQTGEVAFNERWAQIAGYTLEELAPVNIDTWVRLVHPEDLERSNQQLAQHFSGETEQYDCECRIRHKDGGWVWIQDRGRVTRRTPDGKPLFISGTHMDIGERKKVEQFREDVERITRHDLKTPLSAFTALPVLLLQDDNLTEDQRTSLGFIRDAGQRMLGMINLSLDLFKMETGAYNLPRDVFPLSTPLDRALADVRSLIRACGLELDAALDAETRGVPLRGDEDLLVSLLENLLKNALEASPKGERLELRAQAEGATVTLALRNAGAVPEDVLPRFFEKYATSGKRHGTGLGTYSARLVARAHGGELTLDAGEPGHTTLLLTLPLAS